MCGQTRKFTQVYPHYPHDKCTHEEVFSVLAGIVLTLVNGLKLSVQQCFGVLRYLIVVFFFEPGKVTLFHHPSPSALETAPVRKSVLQLHLNLTESELSLHRRNNVHISPRTCFSKTLLQPHFGFENEYVDTAESGCINTKIVEAKFLSVGSIWIFEQVQVMWDL